MVLFAEQMNFGVLTLFDHVTIIAIFVTVMIEATLICSRTSVNDDATETLQLQHSGWNDKYSRLNYPKILYKFCYTGFTKIFW